MAKKQQPKLSYGPNMGLIAGEAAVAQSEANLGNTFGAFAQGFQTVFGAIQKEEEERAAKMEAYAAEFPGLEQMNFMANATNKQVVTDFLNTQRDEYNKLAATYEKTKDRKVMDQMNAIKFSIANLDDQIKVFNQDKQEYRTAFDEDQLASGQVFDKDFYTNIFTNNAKFNIAENGDIAFDISGKKNKSNLYKDHAGNWTNRNNISESSFLEIYARAQASGEQGNAFYRDTTYRALLSNLKATGNEGLQTFVTTDLTGDNSDFTFQQQWANGMLDAKFYKGRKKEDGTDWMFDNKNAGELRKLAADYYTDVVEDGYDTGKKNYVPPTPEGGRTKQTDRFFGFSQYKNETGGDPNHPDGDKRDSFQEINYKKQVENRNLLLNPIDDGKGVEIPGVHYRYKFNVDKNTWQAFYNNKFIKDISGGDIAKIEGLRSTIDIDNKRPYSYFNFETSSKRNEETPPSGASLSLNQLKVKKASDLQKNILNVFDQSILDKYTFKDATRTTEFGTDRIQGSVIIKSKDGKFEKTFNFNKPTNELAVELSDLFAEFLPPDPLDPNN